MSASQPPIEPVHEPAHDGFDADVTSAWLDAPSFDGLPDAIGTLDQDPTAVEEWADVDDHDRLLEGGHLSELGVSVVADVQAGVPDAADGIAGDAITTAILHVAACSVCPARIASVRSWAREMAAGEPDATSLGIPLAVVPAELQPVIGSPGLPHVGSDHTTAPVIPIGRARRSWLAPRYVASAAAVAAACTFAASSVFGDATRVASSQRAVADTAAFAAETTVAAAAETTAPLVEQRKQAAPETAAAAALPEADSTVAAAALPDTDQIVTFDGGVATVGPDDNGPALGRRNSPLPGAAGAPAPVTRPSGASAESAAADAATPAPGPSGPSGPPGASGAAPTTRSTSPAATAAAAPAAAAAAAASPGRPATTGPGLANQSGQPAVNANEQPPSTSAAAPSGPSPTTVSANLDQIQATTLGSFESVAELERRLRADPTLGTIDLEIPCAKELRLLLSSTDADATVARFGRAFVAQRPVSVVIAPHAGRPSVVIVVDEACKPVS